LRLAPRRSGHHGQLPSELKPVCWLNAAELDSGRDFDVHAERLMRSLEGFVTGQSNRRPGRPV
jgi:hypothetical protein